MSAELSQDTADAARYRWLRGDDGAAVYDRLTGATFVLSKVASALYFEVRPDGPLDLRSLGDAIAPVCGPGQDPLAAAEHARDELRRAGLWA